MRALMNRNVLRAAVVVALAAAAAGCFTITSHDEYASYRRLREEPRILERARLASAYLDQYPDGRMRTAVGDVLSDMDDNLFWECGRDSNLLELYLKLLPGGKNALSAQEQINANAYFEERQRAAEQAEQQRIAEEAERLRQWEERLKVFVHDGFRDWILIFAQTPRVWGHNLDWINREYPLFYQYWASEPYPTCEVDATSCRKRYEARYTLEQHGGIVWERHLTLTLQLDFQQGKLFRVALYLDKDGFANWYELETNNVNTADAEPYVRQIAAQYFVEYINQFLMAQYPTGEEVDPGDERVFNSYRSGNLRFDILGLSGIVGRRIDALQITDESLMGLGVAGPELSTGTVAPPPPTPRRRPRLRLRLRRRPRPRRRPRRRPRLRLRLRHAHAHARPA